MIYAAPIIAFFSGFFMGGVELVVAHKRMKIPALMNHWAFMYLTGNGALSALAFFLIQGRGIALLNISTNSLTNSLIIASLSGPMAGVMLRRLGTHAGEARRFCSYRDRILEFLSEEVQHCVEIKRTQWCREIAKSCDTESLYGAAKDFVDQRARTEPDLYCQDMKYLDDLKAQGELKLIARFIIDAYGDAWTKKNLLRKTSEIV